jgi:hypothetical protein
LVDPNHKAVCSLGVPDVAFPEYLHFRSAVILG